MHLRRGVVNSLPSATQDILDRLGEGFSRTKWYYYQFNCTLLRCKGAEWEIGYLLRMGKTRKPHSCCAKVWTQIQYSFAEPVAAGRQKWKDMGGYVQKTSWLVKDCTKPARQEVRTQGLSSLMHPLTTLPNQAHWTNYPSHCKNHYPRSHKHASWQASWI